MGARTYKITIQRAYDGMVRLGYLKKAWGGNSQGTLGKCITRYKATDKLLERFFEVEPEILPVIIPPDSVGPLIRIQITKFLTDGNRRRPKKYRENLPVPDTARVARMKANLQVMNTVLEGHWVDLAIGDVEFHTLHELTLEKHKDEVDPGLKLASRTLYRVFNDIAMTRGGRFYGPWWQLIPSEYRGFIVIDGKPTVEYDYSGMHPPILYAEKGIIYTGDSYEGIIDVDSDDPEVGREPVTL